MTGNAETIKEFLVALGWKIDENSFKKFDDATGLSTRKVGAMALGMVAAGAAVEVFVAKVSANLDKLYFASKRTGSSAGEINAFSYAVEQMGGSAEEAQASLESLSRFMRTTPGAGALLTRLFGVKPEHLGDAAKMMNDIAGTVQRMAQNGQQPLAYRLSQMIGLDEKTFLAMEQTGKFQEKEAEYNDMLKESAVDLDALTKQGMEFTKTLGTLERSLGLVADKMAGSLLPYMETFNQKIIDLVRATNGGGKTLTWADKLGDRLFEMFKPDLAHTPEEWKKIRKGIPLAGESGGNAPAGASNSGTSSGMPRNNPGNLRSWGSNPIVGGFASFPSAMAGLAAMAKQLELYAQRGNDTINGIINKYAPAGDRNNVPAYIADVVKRTWFNPSEHLNLKDPQVLSSLMNAMIMHENGRNPFETTLVPSVSQSVAGARGQGGPILHQNTTIHVDGSGNPQATGAFVASEQGRVNSLAVRNLAGAVQ